MLLPSDIAELNYNGYARTLTAITGTGQTIALHGEAAECAWEEFISDLTAAPGIRPMSTAPAHTT